MSDLSVGIFFNHHPIKNFIKFSIMKNLKKVSLLLPIFCLLIWSACTNTNSKANENDDSKDMAEKRNDAKFDNPEQKDAQFLVDAANISLEEIQMGELAQTNATMDDTKQLGKMMVTDHQKAYEELAALAKGKNISIPIAASDNAQNDYKKLADDKGIDFDKNYCDKMVNGHKDAIDKFEKHQRMRPIPI
jgi:putative membrane protein